MSTGRASGGCPSRESACVDISFGGCGSRTCLYGGCSLNALGVWPLLDLLCLLGVEPTV